MRPSSSTASLRAGFLATVGVAVLVWLVSVAWDVPDVRALATTAPPQTRYMQVRERAEGRPAGSFSIAEVDLAHGPLLACAVVKAEDRSFFRHRGFDWAQIRKALLTHWGSRMGGSTITQQLAKNLYLGPERTARRKLQEAVLCSRLEASLPKRRILQLYLGSIEWGQGVWGARAASAHYFGKEPGALEPFEATFLAALIPAPRQPLAGPNLDRVRREQRRVLHQLYLSGLIGRAEWAKATRRAVDVFGCFAQGRPTVEALACDSEAPPDVETPSRSEEGRVPWDEALDGECGLDREIRETARFRALRASG